MIQYIACDIKEKVLSTGYISTHFEYAEMKTVGEDRFPAQYIGAGNYESVFDKDVNGHSYLRKTGSVSMGNAPSKNNIKMTSCGDATNMLVRFPLRLVLTVPKEKTGDDAFSDDALAMEVISMLSADIDIPEIQAIDIDYTLNGYNTDSVAVWNSEVSGPRHQMNFNLSYISVDFTAEITINPACLIDACY